MLFSACKSAIACCPFFCVFPGPVSGRDVHVGRSNVMPVPVVSRASVRMEFSFHAQTLPGCEFYLVSRLHA